MNPVIMTNSDYHATPAISKSDLDLIAKSPMHYKLSKQAPREQTPAMLLGSVVHKLVLEPGKFADEYMVAPEVDRRTKDGKAAWAEFLAECDDHTVIDKATFQLASEIADAVRTHPVAAKLLQGGQAELSYFWDNNGIECKCRPDYLREDIKTVIDLKTTQCSSPDEFTKSAFNFRYYVQAIDKKVLRLEYRFHKNGMKTVTIVWLTESGEVYKPINVTADSLLALARDVLKYID